MEAPVSVPIAWGQRLPAPAKLNLFLHVIGRRADGYHRLQTMFRFIDLADQLIFTPRTDALICLAQPLAGVLEESDLVIRAARALAGLAQTAGRTVPGVTITCEKHIPMGGGLGGGSSDAATTLIVLNALWDLGLSRSRLAELGLALGADVPVFIHGHNAFAEGVGEALTPVDLMPRWYVVVVPQVAVPTAEIFSDPALTRDTEQTTITAFFAQQQRLPPGVLWGRNDLEAVVFQRYPEVARRHASLARFGAARMTGSGSCIFLELESALEADAIVAQLPQGVRGFRARGLHKHPLA